MEQLIKQLKEDVEVRAALIEFRRRAKGQEPKIYQNLLYQEKEEFRKRLQDSDAKVRKNVALILGELQGQEFLDDLYQAYCGEQTLFVRSDYLKAMSNLDYSKYEIELKEQLTKLKNQEVSQENQKHLREEIAVLQKMVLSTQERVSPSFCGNSNKYDVILTTNRNYREVIAKEITGKKVSIVPLGVKVLRAEIDELWKIRTFREILFLLDVQNVEADPSKAADTLAVSNLIELLKKAHGNQAEFYFRITIATNMALDKRSDFIKKCSFQLEKKTKGKCVNAPSDYDMEIKLYQRTDGTFLPLVKFHTLKDLRFAYRKESIAASIHPSQAALLAELSKPYFIENAQVLDPFCGVGTMLLERNYAKRAGSMYGVDIFGEAIKKARENTARTKKEIYYIQRDFFDFHHDYLFDEIFTNMPMMFQKTKQEQESFYQSFFKKAEEVLKIGGFVFLYSNEKNQIKKQLRLNSQWKLIQEFVMNEKEGFSFYVIGKKG